MIKNFWEEDEVRAVNCGGFDMNSSKFDVLGVSVFGFCVDEWVLPRICWMVAKRYELQRLVNFLIAILIYEIFNKNQLHGKHQLTIS